MTIVGSVVYMTDQEFKDLPEYSCSLPTGLTVGKRWKRGEPYRNPTHWIMGEYTLDPRPNWVGIAWRDIVIGEAADHLDFQI